jgi:hypothetical protein
VIGAKTLTAMGLLVVAGIATRALGLLRPERLLGATISEAFFVGIFAVVVGTLMFRFMRFGERSANYFRFTTSRRQWEGEGHFLGSGRWRVTIGPNLGEAFDFGPRLQGLWCFLLALVIGVATIDARAVQMLGRFPQKASFAASTFCPDTKTAEVEEGDPNAPGCALIRRAYQLGYAQDLGDCGRKRTSQAVGVCTLRQRDEPFFHYAWRLLLRTWGEVQKGTSGDYVASLKKSFDQRVGHLDMLTDAQREVLASAPRASHHVWTNLPDPRGAIESKSENCLDRYRTLPHRPVLTPGGNAASEVFEHIFAQLLFEARYEPAAGYCREYEIHWGASPDACQRLAAAPEDFLAESGALRPVRAALARQKLGDDMETLAANTETALPSSGASHSTLRDPRLHTQRQLDPSQFVSFQCYIEGNEERRSSIQFTLDGRAFKAEDSHVRLSAPDASGLYVDRYRAVATLFAPGFHYGALLSEAGLVSADDAAREQTFAGGDFLMSHLYGLAGLDIFLEPTWISRHPDVLEVYPYHLHLKNYVRVFRQQYLRQRGRL